MTTNYPFPEPGGDPFYGYHPPAPQPARSRARRGLLAGGLAALAAGAVVAGVAVAGVGSTTVSGSGSTTQLLPTTPGNNGGLVPGDMNGGSRSGTSTSVSLATAEQQKGVVSIVSVLKYQNAESAGTGMILSSDGEILTNNHVINGATSITVTVESTGRSYHASVVGTDPSDDVAVLQLQGASGLTTAKIGDSSGVQVGDKVVGVGNAGGTGTLRASSGQVTALNQSITASDETGGNGERLTGLIEVNAPIISGDSGGPLYDASGRIVGMDTAASSSRAAQTAYAIPIDKATQIADQIESGVETSKIHIGLPAFLGVSVADSAQGAVVANLLPGGPAAGAGITQGSVITAVNGNRVTSSTSLKTLLNKHDPGQRVTVSWTAADGTSHGATVTLATGPAD
jgi:S1-C subfamily serine protease